MSDLLAGLEAFGFTIDEKKMFEEDTILEEQGTKEVKEVQSEEELQKEKQIKQEMESLFDKSFVCPVCEHTFKVKTVRTGRARLMKMDKDLRPIHQVLDPLKYDAVCCPNCGYSSLRKYFDTITAIQKRYFQAEIGIHYKKDPKYVEPEIYSYDLAIMKHKMSLATAIAIKAPASQKAFICIKTAWLYRGKREQLTEEEQNFTSAVTECEENEEKFLQSAYEGFTAARAKELPPICGMDLQTLEYILAVYAVRFGDYDVAAKYVSGILLSTNSNTRLKDKTRELKNELVEKIKITEMAKKTTQ